MLPVCDACLCAAHEGAGEGSDEDFWQLRWIEGGCAGGEVGDYGDGEGDGGGVGDLNFLGVGDC